MIPFRVKKLTETAKAPERANEGDLWDLFADDFDFFRCPEHGLIFKGEDVARLHPKARVLVKTGIAIELPIYATFSEDGGAGIISDSYGWIYESNEKNLVLKKHEYAVADIRPRSGLALKHGITILNTPGTIDNSYRKEIGVILINQGHEPYTIKKGNKIAQMLIRPLYPSNFEIVKDFEDTGRGGFGSTGK